MRSTVMALPRSDGEANGVRTATRAAMDAPSLHSGRAGRQPARPPTQAVDGPLLPAWPVLRFRYQAVASPMRGETDGRVVARDRVLRVRRATGRLHRWISPDGDDRAPGVASRRLSALRGV